MNYYELFICLCTLGLKNPDWEIQKSFNYFILIFVGCLDMPNSVTFAD